MMLLVEVRGGLHKMRLDWCRRMEEIDASYGKIKLVLPDCKLDWKAQELSWQKPTAAAVGNADCEMTGQRPGRAARLLKWRNCRLHRERRLGMEEKGRQIEAKWPGANSARSAPCKGRLGCESARREQLAFKKMNSNNIQILILLQSPSLHLTLQESYLSQMWLLL